MQIFLVGFMGSGKTHWGRIWSSIHPFSFVDLDHAIEKEEGKTIAKIFEENGEQYFRQLETTMLHSFSEQQKIIIACGGGTPCFNNNMQWMNQHGITIYLKATAKQLAKHLEKEQQQRPLLHNVNKHQLENFIEEKLKDRKEFYNQSQVILNVENISSETFKEIIH